jgi:hypothetical protein
MISENYKEVIRDGKYIVYGSGNNRILYDIQSQKEVATYNILLENLKAKAKKAGIIAGLSLLILSPFAVKGFASHSKKTNPNLEAKVKTEKPEEIKIIKNNNNKTREIPRKKIADGIKEDFYKNAPDYITPAYVQTKIFVESSNNPYARNSVRENDGSIIEFKGYPQACYSTWKDVFPRDTKEDFEKGTKDKRKSEEFVVKYTINLDKHLRKNMPGYSSLPNEKKRDYISAAYNWGIGKLQNNNYDLTRAPRETKNYIKKMKNT